MPLILGAQSATAGAYSIDNSCRFNDGDSAYLHFTQGTPTNNLKWTANVWFKMGVLPPADTGYLFSAYPSAGNIYSFRFTGTGNGQLDHDNYVSSSHVGRLETDRFFRDPSAWYCATIVYDSANGVAGDRMKMYINGIEETNFAVDTNPSLSEASIINADTVSMQIGRRSDGGYFDGYMAELAFCDGQAYSASDFGEFNEDSPTIWQPKNISGLTFGNNGCWLDFGDSADLGKDVSGNGNDFTVVNLAAVDQCTESPTNNFAVMNPVDNYYPASTFSEGNTTTAVTGSVYAPNRSTFGMSAGKWYWEFKLISRIAGANQLLGITSTQATAAAQEIGHFPNDWAVDAYDGALRNNNSDTSYGVSWDTEVMGVALDLTNNKLYFAKDNVWMNSGVPTSGGTGTGAVSITAPASTPLGAYFAGASYHTSGGATFSYNFGNPPYANTSDAADENGYGKFEYAPPTGYYALCTKNLAEFGG